MSSGIAFADKATQAMCAVTGSARSWRNTSKPSASGNCMSSKMRSGRSARAAATPLAASTATSSTRLARRPSNSVMISALTGLSSMYSTRWRRPGVASPSAPLILVLLVLSVLPVALPVQVNGAVVDVSRCGTAPGAAARSGAARRRNSNTLPCPAWLCTATDPPMRSTNDLAMARPMPVPSMPRLCAPRRLKGSNRCSCCSWLMPRPVSATLMSTSLPTRVDSTRTSPPARLYLMALDSRFNSTWRKRLASACTRCGNAPRCTGTGWAASAGPSSGKVLCSRVARSRGSSAS